MEFYDSTPHSGLYDIDIYNGELNYDIIENLKEGTLIGSEIRPLYEKSDYDKVTNFIDKMKKKYKKFDVLEEYKKKYEEYREQICIDFKDKILELNRKRVIEWNKEQKNINENDPEFIDIDLYQCDAAGIEEYSLEFISSEMNSRHKDFIEMYDKIQMEYYEVRDRDRHVRDSEDKDENEDENEAFEQRTEKDYSLVFFKFIKYTEDNDLLCEVTDFVPLQTKHFQIGEQVILSKSNIQYFSSKTNPYITQYYRNTINNKNLEIFDILSYNDIEHPPCIKRSKKIKTQEGQIQMTNIMKSIIDKDWIISCCPKYNEITLLVYEKHDNYLICKYKEKYPFSFDEKHKFKIFIKISFDQIYSVPCKSQDTDKQKIMRKLYDDDDDE